MAFIITADYISEGKYNRTDTIGPRGADDATVKLLTDGEGERFRLLDDDGEVYYLGRFIGSPEVEDEFQPLDLFGTPDAGCTAIQYWQTGKDGGWKTL